MQRDDFNGYHRSRMYLETVISFQPGRWTAVKTDPPVECMNLLLEDQSMPSYFPFTPGFPDKQRILAKGENVR